MEVENLAGAKSEKSLTYLCKIQHSVGANSFAHEIRHGFTENFLKSVGNFFPGETVIESIILDVQVFFAEQLGMPVIPGAAERRPGHEVKLFSAIQEDRRNPWIPVFTGMTKKLEHRVIGNGVHIVRINPHPGVWTL
jgi:hypothetical protein